MQQVKTHTTGMFYTYLKERNTYSNETMHCIEKTLENLLHYGTTWNRPGMLLGKIQSGKTRAFIGLSGLAMDNDYDVIIVLTKGTRALARQTIQRLYQEFAGLEDEDVLQIHDIMSMPENLIEYELQQKQIIVVKKETNNLKRLEEVLSVRYPTLAMKKTLMIDDEADFASIGFSKTKREITEINVIAGQIDSLRRNLADVSFLQVTATPYSLYLQPETLKIDGSSKVFEPVKPAFTELVPVPNEYIGGEYYFEESELGDSISSCIYEPIGEGELIALKKPDRRRFKLEEVLQSNKIASLRNSIIHFVVGGAMRRIQQRQQGTRMNKYSFIIHTEQSKLSHEWQETIILEVKKYLQQAANNQPELLGNLIKTSYENMKKSLTILGGEMPSFAEVQFETLWALQKDHLLISKVNSETDINQLLDNSGQLKLRAPLNIFIGGQILDRGITIANLIGFYYGRNPRRYQQDTVLQHSRMYGFRPKEDLAVTRFYTTKEIYHVMRKIHEFDAGLRTAFEQGGQDQGVVFIQQDLRNEIIPCNPNKLLLSKTTTLRPYKRMLPVGFQTGYKTYISQTVEKIDRAIGASGKKDGVAFLIRLDNAKKIIRTIAKTFDDNTGTAWDVKAFLASMEYLSQHTDSDYQGHVWCIVKRGRNMSRIRAGSDRFEDAPDTPAGEKGELRIAKQAATDIPALLLLRQNERKKRAGEEHRFGGQC
ncbi:Z1 domain-containing protein [Oceanobacillus sp. 1P07AA]|uniref:Z1 domain-containing protein n=1 Tax=Oceanobacillus sp. 1P07AA TaxID=3132293 RepID=UPI0039A67FFC